MYFLNQDRMARILELTQTAFGEFAVCLHGDGKLDLAVHSGHHSLRWEETEIIRRH